MDHGNSSAPCQSALLRQAKAGVKSVIAVGSGKGGVGKSSLASMIAIALARDGKKVGILDADITGPSIPKLLGVSGQPYGTEKGIMPLTSPLLGIKVMSINLLLEDPSKPVIWRGPLIGGVIKQFWEEVDWGELDHLIVDLPPGTADAPLTVMQTIKLDGFILVTSPQELSVLVVEKAAHMTQMLNVPLLGVVENMSYTACPHCGERIDIFGPSHVNEIGTKFKVPVLGQVPLDPALATLADAGDLEKYDNRGVFDPLLEGIYCSLQKVSATHRV
ncbi:MAG TPA: Mrp/NBP35 family ATP-binding protein [Synergistales bacterium]|nr:Mrp/NBP35 family ATP-binding protein [Synergistales bacterium]